jgi:hypothetical protein
MYGLGMSYSDIQGHLQELYGFNLSVGELSGLIRKMIYTTNTIESYHRNIRKRRERPVKNKGGFCFR